MANDSITPRSLIRSIMENNPDDLEPTVRLERLYERPQRSVQKKPAPPSEYKALNSTKDDSPRTLITGFLSQQDSEKTVRILPRSTPTPVSLSQGHRPRRSSLLKQATTRSLIRGAGTAGGASENATSEPTPRTIIKGLMKDGEVETPIAPVDPRNRSNIKDITNQFLDVSNLDQRKTDSANEDTFLEAYYQQSSQPVTHTRGERLTTNLSVTSERKHQLRRRDSTSKFTTVVDIHEIPDSFKLASTTDSGHASLRATTSGAESRGVDEYDGMDTDNISDGDALDAEGYEEKSKAPEDQLEGHSQEEMSMDTEYPEHTVTSLHDDWPSEAAANVSSESLVPPSENEDDESQEGLPGFNNVFSPLMSAKRLRQTTLDVYSEIQTPQLPSQKSQVPTPTVLMLPLATTRRTPKQKEKSKVPPPQTKDVGPKRKYRKTSKEPSIPRLPLVNTTSIFKHFTDLRVRKDTIEAVEKVADQYWKNVVNDLAGYAAHAGRTTVTEFDLDLLMKRQRFSSDKQSMYTLVHKYLPLEYQQEVIEVVQCGNKITP